MLWYLSVLINIFIHLIIFNITQSVCKQFSDVSWPQFFLSPLPSRLPQNLSIYFLSVVVCAAEVVVLTLFTWGSEDTERGGIKCQNPNCLNTWRFCNSLFCDLNDFVTGSCVVKLQLSDKHVATLTVMTVTISGRFSRLWSCSSQDIPPSISCDLCSALSSYLFIHINRYDHDLTMSMSSLLNHTLFQWTED